ncbi:MAG: 4Fe-4S binding protein [Desulfobacterales bacterium]|nr:4Fe-4S binding protein [Desulfobacterales bacterium]
MKQLGLMIDMNRCTGCKTCVVACRNAKELLDHEQAMPGDIPFYIRVESVLEGTYPVLSERCWVVPCQHCKNAPCIAACDNQAIGKDPQTGIVRIDRNKCAGSGKCIEACPWDVIQFDKAGNYAHKCDLCYDRVVFGGTPVCAEVCMTDAISFGELGELKNRARETGREIDRKMSAMSIVYLKPALKNTLATGGSAGAPT